MHCGWESCSARKSDSGDSPSRIVDGVMSMRRYAYMSTRVVVIDSRACAVRPDKLKSGVSVRTRTKDHITKLVKHTD